ncbi:unnamed protein product [Colletotrichum noveboracense]|uniref:Uncharacterized protein n=2 Tax=Colletotrichum gloeosporioides species complex TaxID=2707338 RepID=A0A9W4WAT8_9PEZI|nr:uncharacterized protein CGMCC3_g4234 [Colletotrichum fructicola]KAE9579839.1 hypothetical protein CGMCC3_g4234 [Colletotrichum fructicola]KAK1846614.1 hypothetical protein CCHR01_10777 [Colletotrichum chrysophilum]CAI0649242.1 unnamed protein product [Colletotrichum noveboracense]
MRFANLFVAAAAMLLPAVAIAGYCDGTDCVDSISRWSCPKQCPSDGTCAINVPC